MAGLFPASVLIPFLLACFGPILCADVLPTQPCPSQDPLNYTVLLPDPTNCSHFFSCSNGRPIRQVCPAELHFNADLNVCDYPYRAHCVSRCVSLQDDVGGYWRPQSCSSGLNDQGFTCSLVCDADFVLSGSAYVQCTNEGWQSSNGNSIPQCLPLPCISQDLEEDMNQTLSLEAGLLFVLDESGSVTREDFEKTKTFVANIINRFPLSANRSAGVITFDSTAMVRIPLDESSTSNFLTTLANLPYRGGGTDILAALNEAINEIRDHAVHKPTLVFLITDGASATDGTPAADKIKADNNPIFAIGVSQTALLHLESLASSGENGIKHFFHVRSYEILESIGQYLNSPPGSGGSANNTQCERS